MKQNVTKFEVGKTYIMVSVGDSTAKVVNSEQITTYGVIYKTPYRW